MGRSPTDAGRRQPRHRPQRRRFLIACEGDKEVAYFKWLGKRLGGSVVLKPVHRWPAPEHVLDLALRERDADRRAARDSGDPGDVYDGVWIVVDVDEHAHLVQALADADKAGVSSAVSGPCFEIWLILHERDLNAALSRPTLAKNLWASIAGHPHTTQQEFDRLAGHLSDATARADALLARHTRDQTPRHERNPSTEVGLLVRAITAADTDWL
ncbi:MAG: RloB family protein [Propionibacteriaceae bacterium]|jgi:hypothetical protein|nr:RloB family protein [Propionibacteriaceae bacterium]